MAGIEFSHLSPYCIALQDHPAGPSLRMILQDYPAGPSGGLCDPLIIMHPSHRFCKIYIPYKKLIWVHNCLGYDLIETIYQDQGRSLSSLPT